VSQTTSIEWCDHTFNIAWGCMKVSPGCQHCYADTLSNRYGFDVWGPAATTERRTFGAKHWAEPRRWNAAAEKAGQRRRVFCCSMCDVFEDHPTIDAERAKLWPLIRETPWLDWQLLTKRPERIAANLPDDWGAGYPNVWLGTSVESQEYADDRIGHLIAVPAAVRFLSAEPLLDRVSLRWASWAPLNGRRVDRDHLDGVRGLLHWIIVGGESGPGARPMADAWARELRDQCAEAGIAFFLKQLGGFPNKHGHGDALLDGQRYTEMPVPT